VERRRAQLEKSVARYLAQLDTADLQEPSEELAAKTAHLKEKLVKLESEMQRYRKNVLTRPRPKPDIGWIEIPQRSGLVP
jgi:hypothetical protein